MVKCLHSVSEYVLKFAARPTLRLVQCGRLLAMDWLMEFRAAVDCGLRRCRLWSVTSEWNAIACYDWHLCLCFVFGFQLDSGRPGERATHVTSRHVTCSSRKFWLFWFMILILMRAAWLMRVDMKYKQQQWPERGRERVRTVCGSRPPKNRRTSSKVCSSADIFMCDSDTRNENLSTENVQQTRKDVHLGEMEVCVCVWCGESVHATRTNRKVFAFEQMLFVKSINKFRSHTLRIAVMAASMHKGKERRTASAHLISTSAKTNFFWCMACTYGSTAACILFTFTSNHWATRMQ